MQYNYTENYPQPQAPPSWGFVATSWGGQSQTPLPPSPHGQSSGDAYYGYGGSSTDAYHGYGDSGADAYAGRPGETEEEPSQMSALEYEDPRKQARELKRKAKLKEERKKQKLEDAMNATRILCFMALWNAFMWALPMFGNSWNQRMFAGFGIEFLKIQTGMLTLHVELFCEKKGWPINLIENKICQLFAEMNGTQSLHAARDLACSTRFSPESCDIMQWVWHSSWIILFTFTVSGLTSVLGGVCLYYYWYVQHLKKIRMVAMFCFAISPIFGCMGFGIWSMFQPDLGDIPRAWTTVFEALTTTQILSIKPINESSIWTRCGWCWFFCLLSCAFSIAGVLVYAAFFKKHHEEKEHMKAERKRQRQLDREIEATEEKTAEVEFRGHGGLDLAGQDYSNYDPGMQQHAASDQGTPLHSAAYTPGGCAAYMPNSTAGYGYGYASSSLSPHAHGYNAGHAHNYPTAPTHPQSYPPSSQGVYGSGAGGYHSQYHQY